MFGGYDPSYNPENLEKKKAENKELDPQQAAMANKWSEAMTDTTAAPEASPEAEPTIPETEPQLQANLEEDMAAAGTELPVDEPTPEPTPEPEPEPTPEPAPEPELLPKEPPVETTQNLAEADATNAANDVAPAETQPAATPETGSPIQHFSPDAAAASNFAPLSPEEQRNNKIAAEEAHGKSYAEPGEAINAHVIDQDNLVAQTVGQNMGEGSIDLNSVGQKLESEGTDIQSEVDNLKADVAEDLAAASTVGNGESEGHDTITANNLAVEAGSAALAAKEAAGEAISEAKHGGDAAMEAIEKANALADQATELADVSDSVAAAAGSEGTSSTSEAVAMAKEAKELAGKAEEIAEAKAEEKKDGAEATDEEEESDEGKTVFSAADFPELNELDPDGGKPKAVSSTAE